MDGTGETDDRDRSRAGARRHHGTVSTLRRRWETLRVVYNVILLGYVLLLKWNEPSYWLLNAGRLVFCCIGANVVFMAGPGIDAYFHATGLGSRWVTAIIFVLGALLSFPLVAIALLSGAGIVD